MNLEEPAVVNKKVLHKTLDKFYTKESIAIQCYQRLKDYLIKWDKNLDEYIFVEPSAGSGVFLNVIKENKIGFDLEPTSPLVIKNDFLKEDFTLKMSPEQNDLKYVFIGNPPFGVKSKLAVEFINKAFKYSDIVGFIVPIQFRKWSVQNRINKKAKLVVDILLPEKAFEFMGKDYKVRCCFQIWAEDSFFNDVKDLRISKKPITEHADFVMYQFNRTEEAKKFFDYDWDFAVPRQGFYDYSKKIRRKEDCDLKKQWIMFKAKNEKILKRLESLDFERLSKKNSSIPGFGKADVVEEYNKKYNK